MDHYIAELKDRLAAKDARIAELEAEVEQWRSEHNKQVAIVIEQDGKIAVLEAVERARTMEPPESEAKKAIGRAQELAIENSRMKVQLAAGEKSDG